MTQTIAPRALLSDEQRTAIRNQASGKPGFLTTLYGRLIAARQASADRLVRAHLARLSDSTLAENGFTADQIAAIRREAIYGPQPLW
jgi:hypothetical protein